MSHYSISKEHQEFGRECSDLSVIADRPKLWLVLILFVHKNYVRLCLDEKLCFEKNLGIPMRYSYLWVNYGTKFKKDLNKGFGRFNYHI